MTVCKKVIHGIIDVSHVITGTFYFATQYVQICFYDQHHIFIKILRLKLITSSLKEFGEKKNSEKCLSIQPRQRAWY